MQTVLIRLIPPTLPEGFCPANLQELVNAIANGMQVELLVDDGTFAFNFGDTVPLPEMRAFPWFRTIGGKPDQWYVFTSGTWLGKYEGEPANSQARKLWMGSVADLLTYDGGENATATQWTGPFWEVDESFAGRSPMGAGVITGTIPEKTLSVAEAYGEGAHLQDAEELAPHVHPLDAGDDIQSGDEIAVVSVGTGSDGLMIGQTGPAEQNLSIGQNTYTTTQQPMPLVHPVLGCHIIMRTNRAYRRVDP